MNNRIIAFRALEDFWKRGIYMQDTLTGHPFAQELAYGTLRRHLALQEASKQLSSSGKLNIKRSAKIILEMALYEFHFMKSPHYALADEAIKLCKEVARHDVKFVSALLRKLEDSHLDFTDPVLKYSYPRPDLIPHESLEVLMDYYPPTMRIRKTNEVVSIPKGEMDMWSEDPSVYIQNGTPVLLMKALSEHTEAPKTILDMCASPGGKLLMAHDLYPDAKLYANDASPKRMKRLEENCKKYNLDVTLTCEDARTLTGKYDLVILDVPCSNTGVLHKKPEARYRHENLVPLQQELLARAISLGKQVWYLTCSLLKEENDVSIATYSKLQLPTKEGLDGGFGAIC